MKKMVLLLAWLVIVQPLRAAEEGEKPHDATPAESASPILSLLLLPASLLAKMAAALSPAPPKAPREPAMAGPPASKN